MCHYLPVCRAVDAGVIPASVTSKATIKPVAFLRAAEIACGLDVDQMTTKFPEMAAETAPYLCLDLTLQFALLTRGMKIPEQQPITLVKQVEYRGDLFEAAWPLGAAINTLGS